MKIYSSVNYEYDKDFFTFTLTEKTRVILYTLGDTDTIGFIYDSSMNEIYYNDDDIDYNFHIVIQLEPGTYYLEITGYWGDSGPYELHFDSGQLYEEVTFNNQNLEQAVRDYLNIYIRPLYLDEIESITYLYAYCYGITDLSGIEYLINLEFIDLVTNLITDITPLLSLPHLEEVYLLDNFIDLTEGNDNYNVILHFIENGIYCDLIGLIPDDYSNTFVNAQEININTNLQGTINYEYDKDFFTFTLTEETRVILYTIGDTDTEGYLYNSSMNEIYYNDDFNDGNFNIIIQLEPGTYYLEVTGYGGNYGPYELHFDIGQLYEEVTLNDANLEQAIRDNLDIYDRPLYLDEVESLTYLYADSYGITDLTGIEHLTNLESIELTNNLITDITSLLLLPNLIEVYLTDNPIDLTEGNNNYNIVLYFIENGIHCDLIGLIPDDYSNTFIDAQEINLNSNLLGILNYEYDKDFFTFTLIEETRVILYTTGITDTEGYIYDSSLSEIYYNDDYIDGNFKIIIQLEPGTYYLEVTGYSGNYGPYELYFDSSQLFEEVTFNDVNLERAIRDNLDIYDRPLYLDEVESLTYLYAEFYEITDLTGIENLINLQYLYLSYNNIIDISVLTNLTNLIDLELRNNIISDISNLDLLNNLHLVLLENNPIDLTEGNDNYNVVLYFIENEIFCDLILLIPDDYSNTFIDAQEINLNSNLLGILNYEYDKDFFTFTLIEETRVILYTTGITDTEGYIYDSSLSEIYYNDDYIDGNFKIIIQLEPGTYYLEVTGYSGNYGPYELHFDSSQLFEEVTFNDVNLERAIRDNLDIYDRPLYLDDVESLTYLYADSYGITDLTGIENLINLQYLNLSNNIISDISLLINLNNLTDLELCNNNISDISNLNLLNNLYFVLLGNNPIDLTEGNDNYNIVLYFIENEIFCDLILLIPDDYSNQFENAQLINPDSIIPGAINYPYDTDFFTFIITEETRIILYTTGITDTKGYLYDSSMNEIYYNDDFYDENFYIIIQLEPGTYYLEITGYWGDYGPYELHFNTGQLYDEVIFNDFNLELVVRDHLNIYDRPLYLDDVDNISSLYADSYEITDLTGIEYLTNLTYLNLSFNNITDISSLNTLINLTHLDLSNNNIYDISVLSNLININDLYLNNNQIFDILPLLSINDLYFVFLDNNPLDLNIGTINYIVIQEFINNGTYCDLNGIFIPDDYSDIYTFAYQISINSSIQGYINYPHDKDFFKFTLTEETRVILFTIGDTYTVGYLYDSLMNEIYYNENYFTGNFNIVIQLQPGDYYLKVTSSEAENGIYQLFFTTGQLYEEVTFNDIKLEQAIRDNLGIYDRPLYLDEVENLTYLYADSYGITDLTGIEYLTNLGYLELMGNLITDITPLLLLPNLYEVYLTDNLIDLTEGNANYNVILYFIENNIYCDLNGILIPDDYSDIYNDAQIININSFLPGTINYPYDKDFFTFTLLEETMVVLYTIGDTDTMGFLYNSSMNVIYYNDDYLDLNFEIVIQLEPGTYYLKVTGYDYEVGSYELHFDNALLYEEVTFNDSNLEQAIRDNYYIYDRPIFTNDIGRLPYLYADSYGITDLTGIENLINLHYLDLSNNNISDISNLVLLNNLNFVLLGNNPIDLTEGNDNYNIILYFIENNIYCDLIELIPDDYSNTFDNAQTIEINTNLSGIINYPYETDFFTFTLLEEKIVILYTTGNAFTMGFIYNSFMNEIYYNNYFYDENLNIIIQLQPGTYYLEIIGHGGNIGTYNLYFEDGCNKEVTFNDLNLEQAIRDNLDIYDRTLYLNDVKNLTTLYADSYDITDLSGIEYLINLQYLTLCNNNISDISLLINLRNLTDLEITDNFITDLYPLSLLPNLEEVYISNNPINITEENINLYIILYFIENEIYCDLIELLPDDYSNTFVNAQLINPDSIVAGAINYPYDTDFFTFTLLEKTRVILYTTGITDTMGFLYDSSMNEIYYNDNNVDLNFKIDIQLEPGIYYLKVTGYYNQIGSYELYFEMEQLNEEVTFNDQNLEQVVRNHLGIYDRPIFVDDVESITFLDALDCNIIDITGIEYFTNLSFLDLGYNNISDISLLSNLTNLSVLYLDWNQILDITPLLLLPNLNDVYLTDNPIDLTEGNANYNVILYFIENGIYCDLNELFDDYSNQFENAQLINIDSFLPGIIDYEYDKDFFTFTLLEETMIVLYTTGNSDTMGFLYDSSMNEIYYNDDDIDLNFKIFIQLEAGSYYLKITGYDNEVGPYEFHFDNALLYEEVTFNDSNLEQAIRDNYYIYDRPIFTNDLEGITYLYADSYGITDLTGIEYLINLEYIELSNNLITDITPLLLLPNLNEVYLTDNPIDLTEGNDNYNVILYFIENGIYCDLFV